MVIGNFRYIYMSFYIIYISQKSENYIYPTSISYLLLYKKKIKKIYKKKLDGFTTVATSDGFTMQRLNSAEPLHINDLKYIYIYIIYIYKSKLYI